MANTIPRAAIDELTRGINTLSAAMRERLAAALASIDLKSPGARDAVKELMQTMCGVSADASALLAAQFYDAARNYAIGEPLGAVAESMRLPLATSIAVDGIFDNAKTVEGIALELLDRLDYETKRAAGNCAFANGRRDPAKPKFARVPSGSDTCPFCLMLASRGFVYRSERSAGAIDHRPRFRRSDCRGVRPEKAL